MTQQENDGQATSPTLRRSVAKRARGDGVPARPGPPRRGEGGQRRGAPAQGAGRLARHAALIAKREAEIMRVARRLFAKYGYRRTQIDKVADALKVGKGTVYRYFGSKKKLFLAVANDAMRQVGEEIFRMTRVEQNPLNKIGAAIRAQLECIDQNPDIVEILLQERTEFRDEFKPTYLVYRDANLGQLENVLRQAMAQGIIRPVNVTLAANMICDLVYGVILVAYMRKDRHLRDVADHVIDTLFNGLLIPPLGRDRASQAKQHVT